MFFEPTHEPFSAARALLLTVAAMATAPGIASAQELTADVIRDPVADLATYTVTVQAPVGSDAFLFGSFYLSASPVQFPGVFNPLMIDPFVAVTIDGFIPVLPTGMGNQGLAQSQLLLPAQDWSGIPICLQAAVIDPAGNVAFSNFATANQGGILGAGPFNFGLQWHGTYDPITGVYDMNFEGNPGDNVEMKVNGGQKAGGRVVLDRNGRGRIVMPVPGGLQRGDQVEIYRNGVLEKSWTYGG